MQDVVMSDLLRYHHAVDAAARRRRQTRTRVMPEDVVSIAAHVLNGEESPLLPVVRIFQCEDRPLTDAEFLALGKAVADVLDRAIEDLVDNTLAQGWVFLREE